MRPLELEAWVISVLDRVRAGSPIEDSRIEVKRDWIEADKAARRLGGLANAALGEPVLWLVGVDEKAQAIPGASAQSLPSWVDQVNSCFSEVAPRLILDLVVPYEDCFVIALLFETERAPYVVRNPAFGTKKGAIELEVPWRNGTRVQSARRQDLLRILTPVVRSPKVNLMSVEMSERGPIEAHAMGETYRADLPPQALWLVVELYVIPASEARVIIPFHDCSASIILQNSGEEWDCHSISLSPLHPAKPAQVRPGTRDDLSRTAFATRTELVVDGPCRVHFSATADIADHDVENQAKATVILRMLPAQCHRAISLTFAVQRAAPAEGLATARWELTCARNRGQRSERLDPA